MKRLAILCCALFLATLSSCDYIPSEDRVDNEKAEQIDQWEHDVDVWKNGRLESLQKADGWLTLIGLEWIEKGSNRIGSSSNNEVIVRSSSVPEWLGVIVVDEMPMSNGDESIHAKARFIPKPGVQVLHDGSPIDSSIDLQTDQQENTTFLTIGSVQFHLIERGDRLAVRIKDGQAKTRTEFEGLDYYPFDPSLHIEGRFEPDETMLDIGDVTGYTQKILSPGTFHFELEGTQYDLLLLDGGPDSYFVIFSDETSGRETYGAGRYLYMDTAEEDGTAVIDFNKAYNPPCVFTSYATCPLPPRQNRLPIAIRAGEKMYSAGHEYSEGEHEP